MSTRILSADLGFASTGLAVFEYTAGRWCLFDTKCLHTVKGHTGSVAHDDVRRSEFLAAGIMNYFIENKCSAMVAEIPHGGAQAAISAKCMGAATGMIAAVRVALGCPCDWIAPTMSRAAAGWDKLAHKDIPIKARKLAMKRFIMATMQTKYPAIAGLKIKDKEHIADACAAFEAARDRDIVKGII